MSDCPKCNGTGENIETAFACDSCGGTGKRTFVPALLAVCLAAVALGLALTLGHWLWHFVAPLLGKLEGL